MTQLKDKNNQDVMPKTTADNVAYDSSYSVAQKIAQIEQDGGGSSSGSDAGVAYPNLFNTDDIQSSIGIVYQHSGAIESNGQYKCVFIPLEYDTYYCISGYTFTEAGGAGGANNIALAYGSVTSFQNLVASQFVSGSEWMLKDTVFAHTANIFHQSIPSVVVFKTPATSDLVDSTIQLGLVINTTFAGKTPVNDTLKVTQSMFPIDYGSIKGKNVAFFGDSITEGTNGGFVGLIKNKLGLNIAHNYGSSGAASGRLASIMLGNSFRESQTNTSYKDYMKYQAVVIQIGTNGGASGNIDNDIPDIGIYDIGSYPYEYSSSGKTIGSATVNEPIEFFTKCFANTYYGNVALCIEYVRYINPNCRIFLTTIPPDVVVNGTTRTIANSNNVRNAILALAVKMGVQVIDARENAGLSLTNVMYWTKDGSDNGTKQHFNEKGNEMWASYIAHELERQFYETDLEN